MPSICKGECRIRYRSTWSELRIRPPDNRLRFLRSSGLHRPSTPLSRHHASEAVFVELSCSLADSLQAYHSVFNEDPSVRQVGNMALLPINTKIRGPGPIACELPPFSLFIIQS